MKTLIVFDIPKSKTGKTLRMRILRKFAKEGIERLQDSVWDISSNTRVTQQILDDFEELKEEIERESKSKVNIFLIKGKVDRL